MLARYGFEVHSYRYFRYDTKRALSKIFFAASMVLVTTWQSGIVLEARRTGAGGATRRYVRPTRSTPAT